MKRAGDEELLEEKPAAKIERQDSSPHPCNELKAFEKENEPDDEEAITEQPPDDGAEKGRSVDDVEVGSGHPQDDGQADDGETTPFAIGSYEKRKNSFFMIKEIYDILKTNKHEVLKEIPSGNKSNRYMLLDESALPRTMDGRRVYYDGIGRYQSNSHNYTFILPNFEMVAEIDGCIYKRKSSKIAKESTKVDKKNIIRVNQLKNTLVDDKDFKRKITRIEGMPTIMVEYMGKYDSTKLRKTRTNPKTIKFIQQNLQKKPIEIYRESVDTIGHGPKDLKCIYNQKARSKEDTLPKIEDLTRLPSVQSALYTKKSAHPNLVLFKDVQIDDLVYHLKNVDDLVLGIHRTFNVGQVCLTSLVYENRRVVSKGSKDHFIMLGPVLIHCESTVKEYSYFLQTVKTCIWSKLDQEEIKEIESRIIFGTDQEEPLINAIEMIFPISKRRQCTLDLKKSLAQKMVDDDIDTDVRDEVMEMFFKNNSKQSEIDENKTTLVQKLSGKEELCKYVEGNYEVYQCTDLYAGNWTNDHCESIDNLMKTKIDWKPQNLRSLIHSIGIITDRQFHHLILTSLEGSLT